MKLLIVRHGDPDYEHDTLTEKGWREAEYLSEELAKIDASAYYVSPLGRAKDTASCTLKKVKREAVVCEWLREFNPRIWRPDVNDHTMIVWDWLPQDWMKEDRFFEENGWYDVKPLQEGEVKKEYDWVIGQFDALLKTHGYARDGRFYRAERANNDTLVFFCHFGLECVLLSHLLNVSPMVLWHGLCAAPSSVTTVVTEERRKGIVCFRMTSFADTTHLYLHGEEPSFAARFCECYDNPDERHD